jgi:site-specific recombinase XerD
MKGVFLAKKPKPKYSTTWDVGKVLDYLKSLYPLEELDLKNLTLKTASLIALTTAQRVQTLVSLKINQMADHGEYVMFMIYELQKTSRPGHEVQVKISSFPDKRCCVLHTLRQYLKATKEKRKSDKLLISFKAFNEISTSTVACWLKEILKRSGIDDTFSAHSYRGASTSAAFAGGVQLKEILETANWANAKTFYTFYRRDLPNAFSDTVLRTSTSADLDNSFLLQQTWIIAEYWTFRRRTTGILCNRIEDLRWKYFL